MMRPRNGTPPEPPFANGGGRLRFRYHRDMGSTEKAAETPHLLSVSRRSDVAAFHSSWFLERLREGFVEVRNPFRRSQIRRVDLRPSRLLGIVFWTRWPRPLRLRLSEIQDRGIPSLWQVTLNAYPRILETHCPPPEAVLGEIRSLAESLGPERVRWRYDPILLSDETPASWHLENFAKLSSGLEGSCRVAVVSFLDLYGKTRKNLARTPGPRLRTPCEEERRSLLASLAAIAASRGIRLETCCEPGFADLGIPPTSCVDASFFGAERPPRPTRKGCGCRESIDIGFYDSCLFGCRYCYATRSRDYVLARRAERFPAPGVSLTP